MSTVTAPWWRNFQTEPVAHALPRPGDDIPPGILHLANGRKVYWTGRMLVGLRHGDIDQRTYIAQHDIGRHAEQIQTVLLDHHARTQSESAITYVGNSRRERLKNAAWWVVGTVATVALFWLALTVTPPLPPQ